MKICGISGSLRAQSYNTALLKAVQEVAAPDHEVVIAEYADIPLYNGDLEAEGIPASVERVAGMIREADALLIVTPEYNAGIPGVLKNAMDWVSRIRPSVYDGKPTAMMGTSPGRLGTVRAQMQLRNQLANLNCRTVAQPMIYVGEAGRFFDEGADGLDDATKGFIRKQLAALAALAAT
jgi:chromate reductase